MKVYITEMLRFGETESHHYIVGVFATEELAEKAGIIEKAWRGNKYEYRIVPEYVRYALLPDYWKDKVDWFESCYSYKEGVGYEML